jgi:hypothetical protein
VLTAMMLDKRITDFATLTGLVLVLLTLFTGQRATTLRELPTNPKAKKVEATQEMVIDAVLALATTLLFLAGLPAFLEAIERFHPLAFSGPLRGAFAITWLLLLGLIVWQLVLFERARKLKPKLAA